MFMFSPFIVMRVDPGVTANAKHDGIPAVASQWKLLKEKYVTWCGVLVPLDRMMITQIHSESEAYCVVDDVHAACDFCAAIQEQ